MDNHMTKYASLDRLIEKHKELKTVSQQMETAIDAIIACYENGGKVLVAGNGGSSSDSEHIIGELLKGFNKKRPLSDGLRKQIKEFSGDPGNIDVDDMLERLQTGLPAISLTSQSSIITAVANDIGADLIFAQQVMGLGKRNDIFIGLSTSGNADNVCKATIIANGLGLTTISMTGEHGGKLSGISQIPIKAPAKITSEAQEYHLAMYHVLCDAVEDHFFDK
jgi:D-sedoheptulose 7-phosphate isomerase